MNPVPPARFRPAPSRWVARSLLLVAVGIMALGLFGPSALASDSAQPQQGQPPSAPTGLTAPGTRAFAAPTGLTGIARNAEGAPLADICVKASRDDEDGVDDEGTGTTGPDGRYTIAGLLPGTYDSDLRDCSAVPKYLPASDWQTGKVIVTAERVVNVPDQTLELGGHVVGRVIGRNGKGVAKLSVIVGDNPSELENTQDAMGETDASGHFDVGPVPPGTRYLGFEDFSDHPDPCWNGWYDNGRTTATATHAQGFTVVAGKTTYLKTVQCGGPPAPKCLVPKLKDLSLAAAEKALTRAHCRIGKVRTAKSSRRSIGRVVGQSPAPGRRLSPASAVAVTVGRR